MQYLNNMNSMDAAVTELRGNSALTVSAVARKHSVNRSSFSKRFHGKSLSKQQQYESLRALNDQQEQQFMKWIRRQTELCLPPTPAMVLNIAPEMAGRTLWAGWSSSSVERHKDILDSAYLNNLDLARHKTDSKDSYEKYFESLRQTIRKHRIAAKNMYNIDEKGFMIGVCGKTCGIFTKDTFEQGESDRAGQDGNKEWATIPATICADGTSLSPALIYKAISGDIQDDWLQDFDPNEHSCYFASTENGQTSDKHDLAWLEQVFNKETKNKADKSWRLLFVDGHGSHLNMRFIERCHELKILLAVYPPHSIG